MIYVSKTTIENFCNVNNMITRAFNKAGELCRNDNMYGGFPSKKYGFIFMQLSEELTEVRKYYNLYNISEDEIHTLNRIIAERYDDLLCYIEFKAMERKEKAIEEDRKIQNGKHI